MPRKGLWAFLPLVFFLILAVLLAVNLGRDTESLPTALAGKPLPPMELPSLLRQGKTVTHDDLPGQPFLVNVWATWCPACYVEHPYLLELAEAGMPIIGINYKDDAAAARDYLARGGNPYMEVVTDTSGDYGLELGVYGAPETFLVGRDGRILMRHPGELNAKVWEQKFRPLLVQEETGS